MVVGALLPLAHSAMVAEFPAPRQEGRAGGCRDLEHGVQNVVEGSTVGNQTQAAGEPDPEDSDQQNSADPDQRRHQGLPPLSQADSSSKQGDIRTRTASTHTLADTALATRDRLFGKAENFVRVDGVVGTSKVREARIPEQPLPIPNKRSGQQDARQKVDAVWQCFRYMDCGDTCPDGARTTSI